MQPFAGAARAAEPQVPVLWDAKERLQKPDLSALQRLRFLTTTDFPPFNFLDARGRLSGFHVDLARAICAELDLPTDARFRRCLGPNSMRDARGEGEAIIAGVAVTAETVRTMRSPGPIYSFPARFVMPNAQGLAEPLYDKIEARVGVVAGSAHERMLRAYFGTVQSRHFRPARNDLHRT